MNRGGKAGSSRVDFRRGAEYPEGGEPTFILQEEVNWGETGLAGQDIRGGTEETIGGPPLVSRSPDEIRAGIPLVFFPLLHGCYEGFPL